MRFRISMVDATSAARFGNRTWTWALAIAGAGLFALFEFLLVRTPTLYDTTYLLDLLYLANTGWAVAQGAVPNVDFVDPYGGLIARTIALFLHGPAPSIKAVDQAIAVLYAATTVMLLATSWRRLSPIALFGALLVVTALIVTRNPLEYPTLDVAVASHAMLYNRLAWSWLFVALIAAWIPGEGRTRWLGVFISGLATLLMIVVKPTFGVGVIPIGAAFLIGGRRDELLVWIGATALFFLLFWLLAGVGPQQWASMLGSLGQGGGEALKGRFGPMMKGVFVLGRNFFPLVVALTSLLFLAGRDWRTEWSTVAVSTLLLGVGFGITLTTGSFATQLVQTPVPAMLAVLLFETATRHNRLTAPVWLTTGYAVLVFALPHLLNTAASASREGRIEQLRTIDKGPLAMLAEGTVSDTPLPLGPSKAQSVRHVAQKMALTRSSVALNDQELAVALSDGVRLLQQSPHYRSLGIASPYPALFPFALAARPVVSLNLWREPAYGSVAPLAHDIDILMIMSLDDSLATQRNGLVARAQRNFTQCAQTRLWTVYVRRTHGDVCAALGAAAIRQAAL